MNDQTSVSGRAVIHPKFFKVGVGRVGRWGWCPLGEGVLSGGKLKNLT